MANNNSAPTAKLCQWVCATQYEAIPAEVRKETLTLLYDQVGGMIASATLPSCQPLINVLSKLGPSGECSIIGHPLRTSVVNAALANGTIGQGDEVDATGQRGTNHYAAIVVPTALSVGQYAGVSGRELARAIALGSEVGARVMSVLGHYNTRTQFNASVGGCLGAAVAAGLLLRLNAQQMEMALGLTALGACGLSSFHQEELHQAKSLNYGRAASAGVLSALLAQEGCHGPREVLTVEDGLFDAYLGLPDMGHQVVEGLGEDYLMRQIAYKRYPVGGPNQAPLYAFLKLIKQNKLSADDIEQIEVSISRAAHHTVMSNKHPSIHMETILCLAAVYGDITFSHIHDPRYHADPRVQAFRERARIFIIPRPGPASKAQRLEMSITVRTRSGAVLNQELRYPLMDQAEIELKFRNLTRLRLDAGRIAELERTLTAIESVANVATLMQQLELPYERPAP